MSENSLSPKKILIIARDFIPYCGSLGSTIRILKMGEVFRDAGIEVYFLAAKGETVSYFGYEDVCKTLNVTYLRDAYQEHLCRLWKGAGSPKENGSNSSRLAYVKSAADKVRRELSIPDSGVFFVRKFFRAAIKLIQEHEIENILISTPLHSMQLVGRMLKNKFGNRINLIADYRDSWNNSQIFRKNFEICQAVNEYLEKRTLSHANVISYVSEPIIEKMQRKWTGFSAKSVLVMNGFDSKMEKFVGSWRKTDKLRIGYFGSVGDDRENPRNPTVLLQTLETLKLPISLHLYGTVAIRTAYRSLDMTKHASISQKDAIKAMSEMDVLLILHSLRFDADEVITGKFFDYVLAQRPILVVGPKDMEAMRLVKQYGLGYVADLYSEGDIETTMVQIHSDWLHDRMPKPDVAQLSEFSRQHQFAKLIPMLR